jgi:phage-related minor tail protein
VDLTELKFRTDTSELVLAETALKNLSVAVTNLSTAQKTATQIAKDEVAAEKVRIKAETDLTNLKTKLIDAQDKLNTANETGTKATKESAVAVARLDKLIGNLSNNVSDITDGFTKSNSSTLNLARSFGALPPQLAEVGDWLKRINSLTSVGPIQAITQEFENISLKAKLAAEGIVLTSKQLAQYNSLAKDVQKSVSLTGVDPTKGEGLAEYTRQLNEQQSAYKALALAINQAQAAEKARQLEVKNARVNQPTINESKAAVTTVQTQDQSATITSTENLIRAQDNLQTTTAKSTSFLERHTLAMKIFRGETVQVENEVLNLGSAFTKGQSGQLAMQTLIGGTASQISNLAKEFIDFNRMTSSNTFDNSIQGVTGLKKSITEMNKVNEFMAKGIALTRDEIVNLMRDSERMTQQFNSEGKSAQQLAVALMGLEDETIKLSKEKNSLLAKTKESELAAKTEANAQIKAATDAAKANAFLEKEMNRVNAALSEVNASLLTSNSNRLVKFEAELKKSGMSAADAAAGLEVYRKKLMDLQATGTDKQLDNMDASLKRRMDHLSRSLAPQMSDIAVSLYGGMSPMTVLMQQGLQIRDLIQQSGVEAANVSGAIKQSMSEFVGTLGSTFKAMGAMTVGTIASMGKSFVDLSTKMLLPTEGFDHFRNKMIAANGLMGETPARIRYMTDAFNVLTTVAGGAIAGFTTLLIAQGVAAYQTMKQMDALIVQSELLGGSMGMTSRSAIASALALEKVGITTTNTIAVITEMVKQGGFVKSEIELVIQSAVSMQEYAGVAIKDTVKEFAELKKKPVEALTDLAIATGKITPETLKMVEALKDQGKFAEASALAMKTFADVNAQQVANIQKDYSSLGLALINLGKDWDSFWDSVKKRTLPSSKIEELQNAIRQQSKLAETAIFASPEVKAQRKDELRDLNTQLLRLTEMQTNREADEAAQSEASRVRKANAKTREELDKLELSQSKKKGTMQEFINEKQKEYRKLVGDTAVDEEILGRIAKTSAEEWKKANKERGTGVTQTFDTPKSNVVNIQKEYSSELKLAEQLGKDEREVLKNNYEANLISRGAYLAKDITLVSKAEAARLDAINKYSVIENKAYDATSEAIRNELYYKLSLAKTDKERNDIIEKARDAMYGNVEAQRTFNELQTDKVNALNSETSKRYSETLKETTAVTKDATKFYNDFIKAQADSIEKRKLQTDLEAKLATMSGAEAAQFKAQTEAMQGMTSVLSELDTKAQKSSETYQKFVENMTVNPESISTAMQLWMQAEDTKLLASKARVDAETYASKAGIDAVTAYYVQQINAISASISDAIASALFDGGVSGSKKLSDYLRAELRKKITLQIDAIVNPVTSAIGKALTGDGESSGISGVINSISSGKTLADIAMSGLTGVGANISALGNLFGSTAVSSFGAGLASSTTMAPAIAAYTEAATAAAAAGEAALAASYTSTAAGLSAGASVGSSVTAGLASIGPAGWAAIAIGALASSGAFGHGDLNVTGQGVTGKLSSEGFTGQAYTNYQRQGGLFTQDINTTDYSTAQVGTTTALEIMFSTIKVSTASFAKALGKESTLIDSYSKDFTLALTANADENSKATAALFQGIADELATKLIPNIAAYAQQNETASATLTRLGTNLSTVNAVFNTLNSTLYSSTLAGADASIKLIAVFGTISDFTSATSSYYDAIYTSQEKADTAARQLKEAFVSLGVSLPDTRAEYKALVEQQNLYTDSGRAMYAALLKLAPAFNDVATTAEEAAATQLQSQEDLKQAAEELVAAWQSVTDSIFEEVQRIRGLTSNGSVGYAQAQTNFAIATARAKAGDQTAAGTLPELSKTLLELAATQAESAVDLRRIQALTANSLEQTASYLAGTYGTTVPASMDASAYTGGLTSASTQVQAPVVIASSNTPVASVTSGASQVITTQDNTPVVNAVDRLNANIELLRAEIRADVNFNQKSYKLLDRVIKDGESIQVTVI